MGLGLKITYKKEEINLTDFTIENHVRKVEDIPGRNEFLARNVNSLELNGKYSIHDASKESLEVNKLACWYKVTAHEESCYRKLEFILRDNNDEEYDSLTFEKAFMVDYSEVFNFERSTIDFYALIREFKEEILEADGKSVMVDKKPVVGVEDNGKEEVGVETSIYNSSIEYSINDLYFNRTQYRACKDCELKKENRKKTSYYGVYKSLNDPGKVWISNNERGIAPDMDSKKVFIRYDKET